MSWLEQEQQRLSARHALLDQKPITSVIAPYAARHLPAKVCFCAFRRGCSQLDCIEGKLLDMWLCVNNLPLGAWSCFQLVGNGKSRLEHPSCMAETCPGQTMFTSNGCISYFPRCFCTGFVNNGVEASARPFRPLKPGRGSTMLICRPSRSRCTRFLTQLLFWRKTRCFWQYCSLPSLPLKCLHCIEHVFCHVWYMYSPPSVCRTYTP